jgi:hypothetical protein
LRKVWWISEKKIWQHCIPAVELFLFFAPENSKWKLVVREVRGRLVLILRHLREKKNPILNLISFINFNFNKPKLIDNSLMNL